MSPPPSLLHLTLVTAVLHIHRFTDLSAVPDHLVFLLFQKTLAAGKLTDYVLRMFVATGNEDVLQLVKALGVRRVMKPILPTRCSDKRLL
ncbi:hypothetical protein M758_1G116300 [Ceratodon purpureus]|uniref:Uncharacterized protein n=1 Tax=Ceratodon purpureus TaxID=3225 RepID=A0A8T0J451_CERPU|nr:hypothetical protein KC19_1G121800 [Ceratodon purpureus]KAG0629605.1 hypothetical protein M758_1G116300 [Ceratodon purpureus]